jgi:hypothetical protein
MPSLSPDCCIYVPGTIPTIGCPNNWGQIVRLGFQIQQLTPSFPTAADLIDIADWTTLLAPAALTAQIFLTPLSPDGKTGFYDFKIEGGAPIIQGGGDDTTLSGVTATVGYDLSKFMITGYDLPAAVIKALKQLLRCGKNLTMYLINSAGQIIAKTNVTSYEGFGIVSMTVPDKTVNGSRERTSVVIEGFIEQNYDTVDYITPPTTFALTMVNP